MKIIHLSDTHLVPKGELLFSLDPFARLMEAVSSIQRDHGDADLCVFTGDLTNSGSTREYAAFQEALSHLSIPVQLVIGNHDDRSNFQESFPTAFRDEHGFVQGEIVAGGVAFLFLDTHEPGMEAGRYCDRRMVWLKARLAHHRSNGMRAILFMHHPPVRLGTSMDTFMLQDHAEFAKVVGEAGNVAYIVFGHVHCSVSGMWKSVPFASIRGTNHQVKVEFSLAETHTITTEPPMYGIILIDDERIAYHAHEYMLPAPG